MSGSGVCAREVIGVTSMLMFIHRVVTWSSYYRRLKEGESQGKKCHTKTMMSRKPCETQS